MFTSGEIKQFLWFEKVFLEAESGTQRMKKLEMIKLLNTSRKAANLQPDTRGRTVKTAVNAALRVVTSNSNSYSDSTDSEAV